MALTQLIVRRCNKRLKVKKANVSFTDVGSNYEDPLKNTTSISLDPKIFVPLIKNLKENNDLVVVNVDWGITNERSVTNRQKIRTCASEIRCRCNHWS